MIQSIIPYINFHGEAQEAIDFYSKALGATTEALMHWRDMQGQDVAPDMADKIMYAKLNIGGASIELSDAPLNWKVQPGGSITINVHCDDVDTLNRQFAALAEGGEIKMPLEDTFWDARYGQLKDRFGISWSFNCQLDTQG